MRQWLCNWLLGDYAAKELEYQTQIASLSAKLSRAEEEVHQLRGRLDTAYDDQRKTMDWVASFTGKGPIYEKPTVAPVPVSQSGALSLSTSRRKQILKESRDTLSKYSRYLNNQNAPGEYPAATDTERGDSTHPVQQATSDAN